MQQPATPASYLVTLNGSPQNLLTTLGIDATPGENSIAEIQFQAGTGNAAVVLIGGADLATTGIKLPIPASSTPLTPLRIGPLAPRQLRLSQLYVKGANAETLRVFVIPYNV